ncbi:hypothetical protein AVEN_131516-1 [Araneus ventricosus]|uniref:RNase H type-1 domain-containing protein n=1 Tax=Araneus ventricosus TaxID=182803 RepID=A0A4Y2KDL4_ARAVE|nr:hypothetical protein AVEN_131516-1 [Araneus ventricosus]
MKPCGAASSPCRQKVAAAERIHCIKNQPNQSSYTNAGVALESALGGKAKSTNQTARQIFKILLTNTRIKVSRVKAHAGNIGNERAEQRNLDNPIHILSYLNRT